MNVAIVPFCGVHARMLDVQPAQAWMIEPLRTQDLSPLETDLAHTLMYDGVPVACCGVVPKWDGVGTLWCYLGKALVGRAFLRFNRIAEDYLGKMRFERLEAYVEHDFDPGHRWALMMGFRRETGEAPARKYLGGRDFHLYAKVR